ncbi:BQ5605_C024g09878 [Microbotryum silenes-dioicae]|uniref:BQ5605_C024g09878 protein n=1 Tax=Microbotryum silenes-dioicae TaxID=796604 RepID=A0A2X0MLU9_9BASI|nr:BQ5605_C024g09878 [Microbotryum silenes-dioicae]
MSISPSSRVIGVPPDAESLDSISELGLTRGSRSCQHGEQVQYTYHGPNRFVASHSLDDNLVIRCSLRQLVLSNVKLRLEQLQILCQTHNLQG